MVQDYLLLEKKRLKKELEVLQRRQKQYPKGEMFCWKNGNSYKWYYKENGNLFYISKKNRKLAEQLAEKKYEACKIEQLKMEIHKINKIVKEGNCKYEKASQFLNVDSPFSDLLRPYFKPLDEELRLWTQQEYQTNEKYPENKIYQSISGNIVRSKSELLIDMALYENKIPFRYECVLQLGNVTIYPDFSIRHPYNGKQYYWEHFGMMDNMDYVQNSSSKVQHYIQAGFLQGVNLITTYESHAHPLDINEINKIIRNTFLSD